MWSRDLIRHLATPRALLVSRPHPRSIIPVVYERERCLNWFVARSTASTINRLQGYDLQTTTDSRERSTGLQHDLARLLGLTSIVVCDGRYRIAGFFRGPIFSRIANGANFAKNIFTIRPNQTTPIICACARTWSYIYIRVPRYTTH